MSPARTRLPLLRCRPRCLTLASALALASWRPVPAAFAPVADLDLDLEPESTELRHGRRGPVRALISGAGSPLFAARRPAEALAELGRNESAAEPGAEEEDGFFSSVSESLDAEGKAQAVAGPFVSLGKDTACQADETDINEDAHGTALDEPSRSLADCKDLCISYKEKACQGIAFSQKTGVCTIWTKRIGQATRKEGTECFRRSDAGEPEEQLEFPSTWPTQTIAEEQCEPTDCVDGDEVLDKQQEGDALLETNASARTFVTEKWPGGAVVYVWDDEIHPDAKEAAKQAMLEWESRTCVHFKESTKHIDGTVRIQSSLPGCRSHVGYSFYWQHFVNLGPGCMTIGMAMHQIGHAIGLGHEHQRADVAQWLEVNQDTVQPNRLQMFSVLRVGEYPAAGAPYDLASIMHGGSHFFGKVHDEQSESRTLKVKRKDIFGNCQSGQRRHISPGDIMTVNHWYGCPSLYCADLSYDCKAFQKRGYCADKFYKNWMEANCRKACGICECKDKDPMCKDWADQGLCKRADDANKKSLYWMADNCPMSCGGCRIDDKDACKDQEMLNDPDGGCQKMKDKTYMGQPMCSHHFFRLRCRKTCGLCPHPAYCW